MTENLQRNDAEALSPKTGSGGLDADYFGLLDILPAAAYACDADGLITYFNSGAAEIWGRTPRLNDPADRWCGSLRMLHPDGTPMPHDTCFMALALKENRRYENVEVMIERDDGSRVVGLVHIHPLHDRKGQVIGAVNVVIDITERMLAEQAKGRLAAIVGSADDAIIGKDLDGNITDWNRGAERLFGYTVDEAVGKPGSMLVPPDRAEDEPEILQRIQNGESVDHYETVRRHKDGSLLDISLSVSPIHDASGRVIGASKIARDISGRKRMEEALRDSDRRKDEFLAMLSHELRNPLATIRNSVQLLRMDPGDDMQKKVLGPLERQVGTLARLVDDLMDVSRVTMGRVQLQREHIAVSGLLRDAADAVRREMRDRRHDFTIAINGRDLIVNADPVRMEQVIVNLLTNAAKYTPEGGSVELSADRDGVEVVLRVRDSGIGIRRELLPHVFGLFAQGTTTLDRSTGGLGIGLALVKHLVEMHRGSVAAHSDGPGSGSEFVVRLPAVDPDEARSASAQPCEGTTDLQDTQPLRVLVVDDNRDSADLQATLLRYNGHEVRTAYDGGGALQVALQFKPEVIVLDIGLPGIDGYEVAWRLRQHKSLRDVVLIAMTGYGQPEDRQRSMAVGFDHHLVKPTRFRELQEILASVPEVKTTA